MSRDAMMHVICIRRHGASARSGIAASVFVRPRTCLRDVAALLSTLAAGTTVYVLLEDGPFRAEWRAVASGRAPRWLVHEQLADAAVP